MNIISFDLTEISLDAATVGVVEGQTASVCVDITNSNLLDPTNPPTVQVSTAEDGGIIIL